MALGQHTANGAVGIQPLLQQWECCWSPLTAYGLLWINQEIINHFTFFICLELGPSLKLDKGEEKKATEESAPDDHEGFDAMYKSLFSVAFGSVLKSHSKGIAL